MTLSSFAVTALALWLPSLVDAQAQSFSWGFSTLGASTSLQECNSYVVGVSLDQKGNNPVGVPPFYMLAYPPNGIPSVALLGSDPKSLSWTVNYPSGTSLLLEVADSQGNSGGVEESIYKVTPGTSSSCHGNPSSPITISTTSTSITTCQPLVLNIAGGTPPYTVSIAAQNGLHVYNTTLGPNDNQFTWIDRAIPSDSNVLLATVHDANGQYSPSTSFISVSGSDDVTCAGKNDAGGQQGQQQQPPASSAGGGGTSQPSSGGSNPPPNNSQAAPPAGQTGGSTGGSVTVVQGGSTVVVPASSIPPGASPTSGGSPNSPTGASSGNPSSPTGGASNNNNNNNGSNNPQSNSQTPTQQKSSNTPVIIGSVLGALALIAILALAVIINNKRKNRDRPDWDGFTEKIEPQYPLPPAPTPFVGYGANGNHNGNGYGTPTQQNGYVGDHHQQQFEQHNSPFSDYSQPQQQQHLPQGGFAAGSSSFNGYGSAQSLPPGAVYPSGSSSMSQLPPAGAAGAVRMPPRTSTAFSQSSSNGAGGSGAGVPSPPAGYPTSPGSDWDSRTHSPTQTSTSFSDRQQQSQGKGAVTMNPNPNSSSQSERGVIQHEDGGPVRQGQEQHEDEAPTEVPPAYENIRRD